MIAPAHRGGSGTPLVLLHGLSATWRIWLPVLPELERHHDVFAPTLAGHHGGQPLDPVDCGIPALCDALERTLDDAGIGVADVVGNSVGGWVALELARRGRARSVVAFSPVGAWAEERHRRRLVRIFRLVDGRVAPHRDRIAKALRRPGLRRAVFGSAFAHPERLPVAEAVGLIDGMIEITILSGFAGWLATATPYQADLPPQLPVRIAWGAEDRTLSFDAYGAPWRDRLPHAEFVTLPGCGHVPTYDDPELVVSTILTLTQPSGVPLTGRED